MVSRRGRLSCEYFVLCVCINTLALLTTITAQECTDFPVFEDKSNEVVLNRDFDTPGFSIVPTLTGIAVFDYNSDGFEDIFVGSPQVNKSHTLFRNDGGFKFTDVTDSVGITDTFPRSGVLAADIDNDGNIDLVLGGHIWYDDTATYVLILHNTGPPDYVFEDITASATAGTFIPPFARGGVLGGDINNDGLIDLFFTNAGDPAAYTLAPASLWINDGNLHFTEIQGYALPDGALVGSCVGAFHDFTNDGLEDIIAGVCTLPDYLAVQPLPSLVFVNTGNSKFEDADRTHSVTGLGRDGFLSFPMAYAFADWNNDLETDMFMPAMGGAYPTTNMDDLTILQMGTLFDGNIDFLLQFHETPQDLVLAINYHHGFFLRKTHEAHYEDYGEAIGVVPSQIAWGAALPDFDLDGWPDIVMAGHFSPFWLMTPGVIFQSVPCNSTAGEISQLMLSDQYIAGYACDDSTTYTKAQAETACLDCVAQGDDCGGITCSTSDQCTIRSSIYKERSESGEFSFERQTVIACEFGDEVVNTYLPGHPTCPIRGYYIALEDAMEACCECDDCGGVTFEPSKDVYTIRGENAEAASPSAESSWVKETSGSGDSAGDVCGTIKRVAVERQELGHESQYLGALATGDFDNDGNVDFVIGNGIFEFPPGTQADGNPRLWRNPGTACPDRHWLLVGLHGVTSNRLGIGAKVIVHVSDFHSQVRHVKAGESYLSTNSRFAHFGFETVESVVNVEVHWIGASCEVFEDVNIDQKVELTEGNGATGC